MLFKLLPMCDWSPRLNIDIPKIWINERFSFGKDEGNFFGYESILI